MSNNRSEISSNWPGFYKLWWVVALILFLLLLLLWLLGYGPGGSKCEVPPTIVEKSVEVEKIVDNPELLTRIGVLEKDNAQIASLMTTIKGLKTDNSQLAGLREKIKVLEGAEPKVVTVTNEKLVDNPKLLTQITSLKKENQEIAGLRARIKELENAPPKIIEKIVEKIVKVPVAPVAPVAPAAPAPAKNKGGPLPEAAKLYFDVGSSEFPADTKLTLASVISYLKNNDNVRAVVTGYHDSTGGVAKNKELSIKRAQEVAKLLLEAGISATRMRIEEPIETEGTGSPEEARRVEVEVVNKL